MNSNVKLNKFGFYSLENIPDENVLAAHYKDKYYQDGARYITEYTDEEVTYINNKIEQKHDLIMDVIGNAETSNLKLLELGSGEGWTLSFFHKKEWSVKGVDFSEQGCSSQNPDMLQYLATGNIYENVDELIGNNEKYDVIWLDNVLEHVVDPLLTLQKCKLISKPNTILMLEVPNDFSSLQQYLINTGMVDNEYWVAPPEHISYFNMDGLISICNEAGWKVVDKLGDYPIDLGLLNSHSNYILNPEIGRECHVARMKAENLIHDISIKKANDYYRALGALGLGRDIIAVCKL